jgi:exodeoxyribonuclease VII large subunit
MDDFPPGESALLASETPGDNSAPFSVSELAMRLKRTVEDAFGFVRVRGEISGWKRAASGHCYLCLKDDKAVLDGVLWKATAAALPFRPEDGIEVVATGKLTTYPGRSRYQIVIERLELAGQGALMALLDKRRRALAAEGLFDEERKQKLPFQPRVIGVVTSPTGAVIRDILHRLADRCPCHVLVWPVQVQGEGAAAQVAAAVRGFDALPPDGPVPRPDLLIVARGGGSIEDLWAFNEEEVVRAVAAASIPIISAVGHETDTSLCDFAADVRAPTPTAAARAEPAPLARARHAAVAAAPASRRFGREAAAGASHGAQPRPRRIGADGGGASARPPRRCACARAGAAEGALARRRACPPEPAPRPRLRPRGGSRRPHPDLGGGGAHGGPASARLQGRLRRGGGRRQQR